MVRSRLDAPLPSCLLLCALLIGFLSEMRFAKLEASDSCRLILAEFGDLLSDCSASQTSCAHRLDRRVLSL